MGKSVQSVDIFQPIQPSGDREGPLRYTVYDKVAVEASPEEEFFDEFDYKLNSWQRQDKQRIRYEKTQYSAMRQSVKELNLCNQSQSAMSNIQPQNLENESASQAYRSSNDQQSEQIQNVLQENVEAKQAQVQQIRETIADLPYYQCSTCKQHTAQWDQYQKCSNMNCYSNRFKKQTKQQIKAEYKKLLKSIESQQYTYMNGHMNKNQKEIHQEFSKMFDKVQCNVCQSSIKKRDMGDHFRYHLNEPQCKVGDQAKITQQMGLIERQEEEFKFYEQKQKQYLEIKQLIELELFQKKQQEILDIYEIKQYQKQNKEQKELQEKRDYKNGKVECTICIEKIHPKQDPAQLSCKHRFHKSCIKEWLKKKSTCPVCRKEIKVIPKKPRQSAQSAFDQARPIRSFTSEIVPQQLTSANNLHLFNGF